MSEESAAANRGRQRWVKTNMLVTRSTLIFPPVATGTGADSMLQLFYQVYTNGWSKQFESFYYVSIVQSVSKPASAQFIASQPLSAASCAPAGYLSQ
jgi:PhoPQ-activated pathogenicity-related protein